MGDEQAHLMYGASAPICNFLRPFVRREYAPDQRLYNYQTANPTWPFNPSNNSLALK